MGGVLVSVLCPACREATVEVAYLPENWEGWRRICYKCGHLGLSVMPPPRDTMWIPEEEGENP